MREILTVTYIPKAGVQEDRRYKSYYDTYDVSETLKSIESSEVLWLYLTVIDNSQLRVRAAIWTDHNTILQWIKDNETLMWMRQSISIPWFITKCITLVNEKWADRDVQEDDLSKIFNQACNHVIAINDGKIKTILKNDFPIHIITGEDINTIIPSSLRNIARIFAGKR